jgi:hypothetical protein
MRIRHLIAQADVDSEGRILAPERARHGVVVGGRITALAGAVDPLTHLNLDFPDHHLDVCLVAEKLEVGASLLSIKDGWRLAYPHRGAFTHRGAVDVGARRMAWLVAVQGEEVAP